MKKLIVLVLVVFVVWYGWKHYPQLFERRPSHEVVIRNRSDTGMIRVRVTVDGQTFVRDELPNGQDAAFPFRVANDASFQLVWQWSGREGEQQWSGGMVPRGPMVQRHIMTVDGDGGVVYETQVK
jgi:hypothetical protein